MVSETIFLRGVFIKKLNPRFPVILLIDDEAISLRFLSALLAKEPYNLLTASNGRIGVQLAIRHKPAIVICDWRMPDIDGLTVCDQIKKDAGLHICYFILLTALGNPQNKVHALNGGADDFIQKPPNYEELKARIRAGLRIHKLSAALMRQKNELEFELHQARDYIQSILPKPLEFEHPSGLHISINWRFLPSAHLGGDIFNYQALDEDHYLIYLLDVSGHGVNSALLSTSVSNMLRYGTLSADMRNPAEVLRELNHNFRMENHNDLFFTIWYGVIDIPGKSLSYSCAGHPPAQLFSDSQELQELKTAGILVGLVENIEFEEAEVAIGNNSVLTIFSDGIYEAWENKHDEDNLAAWLGLIQLQLQGNSDSADSSEMTNNLDYLMSSVRTAMKNHPFEDDVTILQVRFRC